MDLVVGSGIEFADRGTHTLKGVADTWRLHAVAGALKLVPGLAVETVESSCCGMAGAFGYGAGTADISFKMGELSLFPAVRKAAPDTLIVADGTSCRHQIHEGAQRDALHVARVLAMSVGKGQAARSNTLSP